MLKIKTLTIKNFLSIGNITQVVDFSNNNLSLILGENLDLGGSDCKNGVGKTSILNALSYGLYDSAITSIKKNNLINKTNKKGMLVTVNFSVNNTHYRIERGRSPNVFRFFINDEEYHPPETNEAQGENKETQEKVLEVLSVSHDMFKNLIALNTFSEPFLSMKAADQRAMIEQLLGITKLSEKAIILKELIKITKDSITEEEFRIQGIQTANKKIKENINSLEKRSSAWLKTHNNTIKDTEEAIQSLMNLDISEELEKHKNKEKYSKYKNEKTQFEKEIKSLNRESRLLKNNLKSVTENTNESTKTSSCPTCGSTMGDKEHSQLLEKLNKEKDSVEQKLNKVNAQINRIKNKLEKLETMVEPESPFYENVESAYEHKSSIELLTNQLEREKKQTNPYSDQIESLKKDGIQEIDYTKMNDLDRLKNHQEFLLKLLTSKDSFIRKKIINQNLNYLNSRLAHYLELTGLPHKVHFMSDLSVEISEFGRDLDFDNLSRGERTRLILSLSWAFRDVYESLNHKINVLFIDELIDGGLDTSGVESALRILKHMVRENNRSIMLISHRDELINRVDNVINVVKKNGFTSIGQEM